MSEEKRKSYLDRYNNSVFIGEAGSGKTEAALSVALQIQSYSKKEVHFFDMDQTKPSFRARDLAEYMQKRGITVHYMEQPLDAPVVASGVNEILKNPNCIAILDIGGGDYGAHMIGQFHEYLNCPDSCTFYLVNPYRIWSSSREDIEQTMSKILGSARLNRVNLMANPNLGPGTTREELIHGIAKVRQMLPEEPLDFVCVRKGLIPFLSSELSEFIIPIELMTLSGWMLE